MALRVEQLPGQQVVHRGPPPPRAQRQAPLHGVELVARDDLRHAALHHRVPVAVDAGVLVVAQHLAHHLDGERAAALRAHGRQRPDDLGERGALLVHGEHAAHRGRLRLVDHVAPVRPVVVAEHPDAVVAALHGVARQPAPHVLGEVRAVVLRQPLQHRLQQDAVRAVPGALRGAHEPHAGLLQAPAVHRRVVAVAREAVELVHVHGREQPPLGVGHHAHEPGAAVRGRAGRGAVLVDVPHGVAGRLDGRAAHPHLVLDGLLALARRAVAGVYRRRGHGRAPPLTYQSDAAGTTPRRRWPGRAPATWPRCAARAGRSRSSPRRRPRWPPGACLSRAQVFAPVRPVSPWRRQ